MQTENPKSETLDNNNISKMSFISHKKKNKKRKKVFWSEREEKTLLLLQMALGSKFSIIKNFIKKDKSVNDIKNLFHSKLITYLSIQISKLESENFFKEIDKSSYDTKKVKSLILSNKIPTMYLNKNVIKQLILDEEQKRKDKININLSKDVIIEKKNDESKLKKKRGRPRIYHKKEEKKTKKVGNNKLNSKKNEQKLIEEELGIHGGNDEGNNNQENTIKNKEEENNPKNFNFDFDKYNNINDILNSAFIS